jgi:hypothetical protein
MPNPEDNKTATLEDVLPTLKSPEAYLRGIFGHLNECKTKHGTALVVRIGPATRSLIPDYRVFFLDETSQELVLAHFMVTTTAQFGPSDQQMESGVQAR